MIQSTLKTVSDTKNIKKYKRYSTDDCNIKKYKRYSTDKCKNIFIKVTDKTNYVNSQL